MFKAQLWLYAATVCLLAVSTAKADYSVITPIPLPPGGTIGGAGGISADGKTVVGGSTVTGVGITAYSWTAGGGTVLLGHLPNSAGFPISGGSDVSADGAVIVGSSTSLLATGTSTEAYRWTSGGGMVGLGDLPGGNFGSSATGVSANGSVVVGYGTIDGLGTQEAFRWTAGGGMVGLGSLPGAPVTSAARGVSADGSVVAGVANSPTGVQAFRWTAGGGMVGLGGLPTQTANTSNGYAISADGSTVVGWATRDQPGSWEAFRWTEATGMIGLGDLSGGLFRGIAYGVSGDGSIVVGMSESGVGETAFIWDQANGMQPLLSVLAANGADLTGWTHLSFATAITPDGRYIVGSGMYNGVQHGYIVSIPEPAGIGLLTLGALALLGRKCR